MTLLLVVQRYGADIAGGSEAECREYAERLAGRGHDVTVLTSCARDYTTWENSYPAGTSRLNGVSVVRVPVTRQRRRSRFDDLTDRAWEPGAPSDLQEAWFDENGPHAPALLDYLRSRGPDFDLVLFFTFRYYQSYFGLPLVADRAVLVPTAEEDPAIRLGVLEEFLTKPAGFLFNTLEEEAVLTERAGRPLSPSAVSGFGLDPVAAPVARGPVDALGVPGDFVLCLGRVDRNKGTYALVDDFEAHLASGGSATTLVIAGPNAGPPLPSHPAVRTLGFVSDDVRAALLAYARVLIVPSPYESLSIALLEGWNHATPALVYGRCRVLRGQVRRANGGLYYDSPQGFSEALTWLLTHPREAQAFGRQGQAYVDREYRWPLVMARVEGLLEEVRRRRGRPQAMSLE